MENKTGDRSDLPFPVPDHLWNRVNVDRCNFEYCYSRFECHYYNNRRDISDQTSHDIIIVNQDYLIAHLLKLHKTGKPILHKNPCVLIIDEAHNLEEKTRNALTEKWTTKTLKYLLKQVEYHLSRSTVYATYKPNLAFLREQIDVMFTQFWWDVQESKKRGDEEEIERFFVSFPTKLQLGRIINIIQDLIIGLAIVESKRYREIDELVEQLERFQFFLTDMEKGTYSQHVYWGEADLTKDIEGLSISHAPKNIEEILRDLLFSKQYPIILTSATLTHPGEVFEQQYRLHEKTIGYVGQYSEPKHSPFDYDTNSRLYIPGDIIPPNNRAGKELYLDQLTEHIIQLANLTEGRTFVLFTAKEDLRYVYEHLQGRNVSWNLLIQRDGSSQKSIIDEFRKTKGVLLATGVFWEGINIDGPDLTQVIITRLPFPVPDPIIEYKSSRAEDPMREVLLPEMITKLRQGAGRLIRSETDKGILSILDSRVSQNPAYAKWYRDLVLSAIPIRNQVKSIEDLRDFVSTECKVC